MAMATMAIAGAFPFSASLARLASTSNSSAAHRNMRSSFISASGLSASSNFTGMSLGLFLGSNRAMFRTSTRIVQVRAKVSMACTKRSRSRKSVARVSGFRARMATPGGRNVLRRRRAKGRWKLVPATNPNSGKRA